MSLQQHKSLSVETRNFSATYRHGSVNLLKLLHYKKQEVIKFIGIHLYVNGNDLYGNF